MQQVKTQKTNAAAHFGGVNLLARGTPGRRLEVQASVGATLRPTVLVVLRGYSLRNVERRPVLCFFKRIEGGSVYQKNLLGRARLYVLHSTAASLPVIRVSRPRKHPRASRVASEWPSVFRTPFGPDQATCVTVRVDIHTS